MRVLRKAVKIGEAFQAPERVTFGYQAQRSELSVWYTESGDPGITRYIVTGTGREERTEGLELVASLVMPDGFHVWHLCRLV